MSKIILALSLFTTLSAHASDRIVRIARENIQTIGNGSVSKECDLYWNAYPSADYSFALTIKKSETVKFNLSAYDNRNNCATAKETAETTGRELLTSITSIQNGDVKHVEMDSRSRKACVKTVMYVTVDETNLAKDWRFDEIAAKCP